MAAPDSFSFKYTLTADDYVRAMWVYLYYSRGWRFLLLLLGCIFVVVAALAVVATVKHGRLILGGLPYFGMVALLPVLFVWRIGRYYRTAARKSPFVGIEHEMTFSPEGMTSRSSRGSSETQWSIFTGARESDNFFLLHVGMSLFYPYPKSAFDTADDVGRFRDLIRANIPDAKLLDQPA